MKFGCKTKKERDEKIGMSKAANDAIKKGFNQPSALQPPEDNQHQGC